MSPQFSVKVEVIPHSGENDPESINKLREVRNSPINGSEGVSAFESHQLIGFMLDSANKSEAYTQVQDMCDALLVNPVLARAEITIEEA